MAARNGIVLLIDVLATTRLTRLVVEDTLPPVKALRDRILKAHSTTKPVMQKLPRAITLDDWIESFGGVEPHYAGAAGGSAPMTPNLYRQFVAKIGEGSATLIHGNGEPSTSRVVTSEMATPIPEQQADARALLERVDNNLVQVGTQTEQDAWAELITCQWCCSMWVALGVVFARRRFPRLWGPLAKALAGSMVAGLIESKLDDG